MLEIAGIGPAPCAGMMFADMGAEVTLVERKTPNSNAVDFEAQGDVAKHFFFNRGKQSIAVNLKTPEGVETVLTLIEQTDVLIEGFRPGVMERLGLGPDICLQRNPALVYGRLSGWGQTGPLAHAAGHDPNYMAATGALWYGGREGQAPAAPLTLAGDLGGGTMMLAWGILCALLHAQKTGQGQVIDAAISDGVAYLSSLLMMMRNTGQLTDQFGGGWPDGAAPWNDTYQCACGGFITICSLENNFYQELLQKLELTENELFANQWDMTSWPQGKEQLKALFGTKTREQWCELLEGTDVCFAPVLNFEEAARHPHNQARETFLTIDGVLQPAPAPKFNRSQASVGQTPVTGQHTDTILNAAGFDDEAIAQLKAGGII